MKIHKKNGDKMICYKDMTFCTFYKDCKFKDECHRPLTPEVSEASEKWMKNAPICMFTNKPECWRKNVKKNN